MKPLTLAAVILAALLPSLAIAEETTFRQTLAKVAAELEPNLLPDEYGDYPVSGPTFWAAVREFLGPELAANFPPYRGSRLGAKWHRIYPHATVYLDSPTMFLHNPDPRQRQRIARFLEDYRNPQP